MNVLLKIFHSVFTKNHTLQKTQQLLPSIVVGQYFRYLLITEVFPYFTKFSTKEWEFFASIGAIYLATNSLPEERRATQVLDTLIYQMNHWDKQGIEALKDCSKFVKNALVDAEYNNFDDQYLDTIGMWVLWNLYKRTPTYEESAPARIIGSLLSKMIENWWK